MPQPVLQVIDDAAKAGLDQFFPTTTTMSQKVAQAQLSALMARRLGVAMTAARADAYLRALAERVRFLLPLLFPSLSPLPPPHLFYLHCNRPPPRVYTCP